VVAAIVARATAGNMQVAPRREKSAISILPIVWRDSARRDHQLTMVRCDLRLSLPVLLTDSGRSWRGARRDISPYLAMPNS
jgi:hypothetical protein